jgi:alpha-amylase/alpha-mannosidase (GH57 family)
MVYWAPLLHFYQPPLQLPGVLRKVCNESYRPLIEVFRQYPHAKATVNICGVLTEMLWEHGHQDVVEGLKELAGRGQIEFVGSAKYHPILPLIPEAEIERQIHRNYETNTHYFGNLYQPRGFFPPEMAYSQAIIEPIAATRHQWFILSGVACPTPWPTNRIYQIGDAEGQISVFFRDDVLSNQISFQGIDGKGFLDHLRGLRQGKGDAYVITAMDAETFGHHIQHWERLFLGEVYARLQPGVGNHAELHQTQPLAAQHSSLFAYAEPANVDIEVVTVSSLLDRFPAGPNIEPPASSWSTSKEDMAAGNPYPLWNDPHNVIHWLQWQHLKLCMALVHQAEACAETPESRNFADIARELLDEALHSCQFWWASKRPMWDINMVSRGLSGQTEATLNAYKAIKLGKCNEDFRSEMYYRVVATRDLAAKIRDRLYED